MSGIKEYIDAKLASRELSLCNLADGAVVEMFDQALKKVLENVADINTALKAKRQIVVKVTIVPASDRTMMAFDVDVSTKLAGMEPVSGTADICIDSKGRGVIARHRGNPQLPLFDNVAPFQREDV